MRRRPARNEGAARVVHVLVKALAMAVIVIAAPVALFISLLFRVNIPQFEPPGFGCR